MDVRERCRRCGSNETLERLIALGYPPAATNLGIETDAEWQLWLCDSCCQNVKEELEQVALRLKNLCDSDDSISPCSRTPGQDPIYIVELNEKAREELLAEHGPYFTWQEAYSALDGLLMRYRAPDKHGIFGFSV